MIYRYKLDILYNLAYVYFRSIVFANQAFAWIQLIACGAVKVRDGAKKFLSMTKTRLAKPTLGILMEEQRGNMNDMVLVAA